MIKEWLEEYLSSGIGKLHKTKKYNFIIYKGFKITHHLDSDTYEIVDVRYNDFYTELEPRDFRFLHCHGFVKGVDLLMYERDRERFEYSTGHLEIKYQERDDMKRNRDMYSDRRFRVKSEGIEKSIREHTDNLFFYGTRMRQIEVKYKMEIENE